MDRWTWGLVAGIVAICAVALGAALVSRGAQTPPDLATPEGVAVTYILAIQNREPDQAWDMLTGPEAAAGPFPGPRGEVLTRETFRQQVLNQPRQNSRRLRLLGSSVSGDTAKVEVQLTYGSGSFLGGSPSANAQTRTFELKRQGATWRISAAPPVFDLA
jgi:hypothetical protein